MAWIGEAIGDLQTFIIGLIVVAVLGAAGAAFAIWKARKDRD